MTDPVEHLARLAGLELTVEERSSLRSSLGALQSLLDALPGEGAITPDPSRIPCPRRPDVASGSRDGDGCQPVGTPAPGSWVDVPPVPGDQR